MNHLDLFSGIGGFSLAARWAWKNDHNVIAFVEKDKYCQKVLNKHWPDVPLFDDIKDFKYEDVAYAESQRARRIHDKSKKKRSQNSNELFGECSRILRNDKGGRCKNDPKITKSTIDLLTAGVPCQPSSVAGKRRGKHDDRWLWPEALRVVRESKPEWIIFENVTGFLTIEQGMAFESTILDLEAEGYEVEAFVLGAVAVEAHHQRQRVWIVAHSEQNGQSATEKPRSIKKTIRWKQEGQNGTQHIERASGIPETNGDVAVSKSLGVQGLRPSGKQESNPYGQEKLFMCEGKGQRAANWEVEPSMDRVVDGIPNRVDRIKGLGNAIVPQVAYEIMRYMVDKNK